MSEDVASPDRLLKIAEVKSRVGLGKSKIYAMVAEGQFPRPYKLTPKAARWSEREVSDWIAQAQSGR